MTQSDTCHHMIQQPSLTHTRAYTHSCTPFLSSFQVHIQTNLRQQPQLRCVHLRRLDLNAGSYFLRIERYQYLVSSHQEHYIARALCQ